MPANPIERRKSSGKTSSPASEAATVRPEKATVRPAVAMVRRSATLDVRIHCALLAEPRHDQQRVVDGEAEPEHRDDVDGVDRDVATRLEEARAPRVAQPQTKAIARQPGRDEPPKMTRSSTRSTGVDISSATGEVAAPPVRSSRRRGAVLRRRAPSARRCERRSIRGRLDGVFAGRGRRELDLDRDRVAVGGYSWSGSGRAET